MTTILDNWLTLAMILCLAAGIILPRALPFLLFSRSGKPPGVILYLGGTLPHASMALLLVYCLKDVPLAAPPHGAPEALAILLTSALYLWRSNVLLGIAGGTAFYMFIISVIPSFTGS